MRNTVFVCLFALIGCSHPVPDPLPPTEFRGLLIRGTAAQAKVAGYDQCKSINERRGFACERQQQTLFFGLQIPRSSITLGYPSLYAEPQEQDPSTLSFWGVTFPVGHIVFQRDCEVIDPDNPNICAEDQTALLVQLERRFIADGWKASHAPVRWGARQRTYFKDGELVSISVDADAGTVKVQATFADDVRARLSEIAAEPPVTYYNPEERDSEIVRSMAR